MTRRYTSAMSRVRIVGRTDVGLVRANNEDVFVAIPERGVAAVADGMGGSASGEVASGVFAEAVREVFAGEGIPGAGEFPALVAETFRRANERIFQMAEANPEHQGMGCTAELIVFHDAGYVAGHVGDSRCYLFRAGALTQITVDHSLVQDQVARGLITPDEAAVHSMRNVILRAVGVEESLAVDIIRGDCRPGDLFLLCSDGLSDMVDDRTIAETLGRPLDLERKAARLVEQAKMAGGRDNVTVVLCEVPGPR